jgi:hypothetical protein
MIQYALYTAPGGALIADYSSRVQGLTFASNNRGFAECKGFVPLSLTEAFRLYDRAGVPHLLVCDQSSGAVYEGRVEDVNLVSGGVNITAFGYSRALSDTSYIALWSTVAPAFREVLPAELSDAANERFTVKNLGASSAGVFSNIIVGPNKGSVQGNTPTSIACYIVYQIPDKSTRQIVGCSFDWTTLHPPGSAGSQWTGQIIGYQAGFTSPATLFSHGAGTALGAANLTFSGVDYLVIKHYYDGTDQVYSADTGAVVFGVRNLRIVTSITNRIATTLTANRSNGANVTATVGSTARMYVGQMLQIGGAAVSESVTVLSIGSATQLNATFINSYVIGDTVQAHILYADEIVRDLVSTVDTLNPSQISGSTALIQSPGVDLLQEVYEDENPADVLDHLMTLGDTQSLARQWEWGVYANQVLYFRPRSTSGRTWYIDISEIDVERTLDTLYNAIYATYQDAAGRTLRTALSSDANSIARYSLTRKQMLATKTTSATQAGIQLAAALIDRASPPPRAGITIDRIFDGNGSWWPLTAVQAGDTIIIRNLAPTLSTSIDRIRVFRTTRAEYHFDDNTLSLEPEIARPTLDVLIEQIARGQLGH